MFCVFFLNEKEPRDMMPVLFHRIGEKYKYYYHFLYKIQEFVDNSNKALDALKKRQNASKVTKVSPQQVQQVDPYADEDYDEF